MWRLQPRADPCTIALRGREGRALHTKARGEHGGELRPKPTLEMLIGPQLAGDGVASIGVASEEAKLPCLLAEPGAELAWGVAFADERSVDEWSNGPYIQLLSDIKKSLH